MRRNIFTPAFSNPHADPMSRALRTAATLIYVVTAGLMPLVFVPLAAAPFGFSKTLFVLAGTLLALIALAFVTLRSGTLRTVFPWALGAYWAGVLIVLAAALLSGDVADGVVGFTLGTQTVAFLVVLGLIMTVGGALVRSSIRILQFLGLFAGVAAIVQVFHIARLFFGPEFLSFGVFSSATSSPLGSLNDLAVFSGLTIVLALITILQLPIARTGRAVIAGLALLSLVPLMVVNLLVVWLMLGIFSLVLIIYLIARDSWLRERRDAAPDSLALATVAVVGVVAAVFVMFGGQLGSAVAGLTGVEYVEVRPSNTATLNIAADIYRSDAFLGIGPNRFADAWRLHKDPAINSTVFWNTDFSAGSSFLSTYATTNGAAAVLAFGIFLIGLCVVAYRALVRTKESDPQWYFIATAGAAGTLFLWLMAAIYVPGPTILRLAAVVTGMLFAAYGTLVPNACISWEWFKDRRNAFIVIGGAVLIVLGSATGLAELGRQYAGVYAYSAALTSPAADEADLAAIDAQLAAASSWIRADEVLVRRAEIRVSEINRILGVPEPTETDQQEFQQATVEGLRFAESAIRIDPTNPYPHLLQGNLYGQLALAGIEGASSRMQASFSRAQDLDPQNPKYALREAQLLAQQGEFAAARQPLETAIDLKRNYTPALFLLSQLEIQAGNTDEAIEATRAVITMEPNNPTRYFQLGLLLSADGQTDSAIDAYEAAIARARGEYANARYLLALAFVESDRPEAALEQLRIVQESNADNAELARLIDQIEAGEDPDFATSSITTPLPEPTIDATPGQGAGSGVPDSDLLTPVGRGDAAATEPDVPEAESEPGAELDEAVAPTTSAPAAEATGTTTP